MESAVLTGAVSTLFTPSADALPRGRFSTGVEQHREAPSHTRVGGFADGCEQLAPARPGAR